MARGPNEPRHAVSGAQAGAFLGEMGAALAPGSGLLDAGGKYYSPTQQRQMPGLLESAREGDYGMAAMQGLGLLGDAMYFGGPVAAAGGMVAKLPKAVTKGVRAAKAVGKADDAAGGIRAYHGSPHDFDRFDINRIGTGEGAQAYGHGLYFAEQEGVARWYKSAQQGSPLQYKGVPLSWLAHTDDGRAVLRGADRDTQQALSAIIDARSIQHVRDNLKNSSYPNRIASRIETLLDSGEITPYTGGRMYEVDIRARPEDFLDWDAPLSQQPESVRGLLDQLPMRQRKLSRDMSREELIDALSSVDRQGAYTDADSIAEFGRPATLQELLSSADNLDLDDYLRASMRELPDTTGESLYRQLTTQSGGGQGWTARGQTDASEALRQAGIPGIRYLDQGSRGAGEGTRNYVLFDDNLVEILRKYGLIGLLGGGAVSGGVLGQQAPPDS